METQEVTYHVKLVAQQSDSSGYINYVFENLNYTDELNQFIMCVRFPNWDQAYFQLEDIGYVKVKYVQAGIDKWYDGEEFIPYKDTNIIFMKFIHEKVSQKEIFVD